jgi:transposase
MEFQQANRLVTVAAGLAVDLLRHQAHPSTGTAAGRRLAGVGPPTGYVHRALAPGVDDARNVGAVPDGLRAGLRERGVLLRLGQAVEVLTWIRRDVWEVLGGGDVHAVAVRYNETVRGVPSLDRSEAVYVPRPTDPANLEKAIQLYLAGKPVQQITTATGVSNTVLHRERTARSIPPRSHRALPLEDIIAAYRAGASEFALARQYGVSRNVIQRRLKEQGVERRAPSAAGKVRAAQMTSEERKRQAEAAHVAARMRRVGHIEKYRHALEVERAGRFASDGERRFAQLLQERAIDYVPQRAIGIYNVDFAVLPVAVEILGGGWHALKTSHAERTPDILDQGWHLLMVWDYEGRSALGSGAASYLVDFLERIRRNPPATCQYRVITGQGELLTARGRENDEFPLVPPPRGR